MDPLYQSLFDFGHEVREFFSELMVFLIHALHLQFIRFESGKGAFVSALYRRRGKLSQRFIHSGMAGITALGVAIAPVVAQEFPGRSVDPWSVSAPSAVLSASTENPVVGTTASEKDFRDKTVEYKVVEGDNLSSIADKFGVSIDTLRWQNALASKDDIKIGETLEILPLTGVSHKVQKGDTVYSIAKKYDVDAQQIVNFPFNAFTNDETFELAIGQVLIVPDGVKPSEIRWQAIAVRQVTPNAGTVTASGSFVWPTTGIITQYFVWYHQGIDIANAGAPNVLAADSGTVITVGWENTGYGNRIIIDHGNGYKTLYGHLQKFYVASGQTVKRADAIGQMGSTGRSSGSHLHFEVLQNGARANPLSYLH